ncbi:MAG: ABC transporter permease [Gemmatimonadaceae bacterium]
MDALRQDILFAVRSLLKSPGFTGVAVLCMALGIAANTFVYSPVNAILIRPLPYHEPDRLMHVNTWRMTEERQNYESWSWPDYQDVREGLPDVFAQVGGYRSGAWNVGGMDEPERVQGSRVTASLFPMLGLRPALGRFFRPEEEPEGRAVVLGHGLWQRKFGADSSWIGRGVTLNGVPYTVVGVMQEGVRFPETDDIWLPPEPSEAQRTRRDIVSWQVVGRLAPGVSMEAANERLAVFMGTLAERQPQTNKDLSAWMQELSEDVRSEVRSIFFTMVGAVVFVLLIACSNVANLLLARGSGRQRELAVRLSMGATRSRLVRQLLTESLLLALLGGVFGVLLGTWGTEAFIQWGLPTTVAFWMRFDIDRTVMLMTLGITVISGLAFGVVPALRLSRPELSQTLKEAGGRGGSAHASVGRLRAGLVVSQLALSLVLLAGAALMVQSFMRSRNATLGLDPVNVLTAQVSLTGDRYATDSARAIARRDMLEGLRAIPGVHNAALAGWVPIGDCCSGNAYRVAGRTYEATEVPGALYNPVSPGYFATFGIRVLRGRDFTEADGLGAARVAVISESMARKEWPRGDAVGQTLTIGSDSMSVSVIGVVSDVIAREVGDRTRKEQIYVPLDQSPWAAASIVLRAPADPYAQVTAVKRVVASLNRDLPISRVFSMEDVIRDRMFEGRIYGAMFAIFGAAALLLASVGLYGVMSYAVAQRTQEVGVRMALGARPRDVLGLMLGSGLRLLALGVLFGVPAAMGLAQLLRGTLYGISATDPMTFVAIPLILAVVALLASYVPARDPGGPDHRASRRMISSASHAVR